MHMQAMGNGGPQATSARNQVHNTQEGAGLRYERDRPIHDLVTELATLQPDATAISFGDKRLSYRRLDIISSALAHELARQGVVKGDVVGLFLPRSLNTIIAQLAILKAGAAYAPFDPTYPVEHLRYMIGDCAAKLIFSEHESLDRLASIAGETGNLVDLDRLVASIEQTQEARGPVCLVSGGDAAYVMYTSGSTGRPKGVVVPHRGIARLVRDQNYIRFRPDDVVLHTATISFDASTFEIWGALLNGCRLVGIGDRQLSLEQLTRTIANNRVTVTLLTTGLFHLLVDHRLEGLQSLRHVLFGGDVGSASHARRFLRFYPDCLLTNAYGPTEVTVMASAYTVPPGFAGDTLPIGKSIAHSEVHILDEQLQEVPFGNEGQLCVSGDGLAIGYFNRPDLTEERFVTVTLADGRQVRVYQTGDMARMDFEGSLEFLGRRDRQVKIDGKRIELDEIESALRQDERLADAIVMCHQDDTGKRIVAYLKPLQPSADGKLASEVLAALRTRLPAHMIPGQTMVLDIFPLTGAGKVDRAKLPIPSREAAPSATDETAAHDETERLLAALWGEVLGIQNVDATKNFFDLGGTSLQLIKVHATLQEKYDQLIDVVALFQHANIRDFARYLNGEADASDKVARINSRAQRQQQMLAQMRRRAI
ncbi:amino acid adenylation domain-containing protein [Pseudaminobacter arsenicus]|uniref:Amino acid adenylation domain-containing protein n=1 Tax=Borborobacter arsenicus TaxID=1851146 RepID=A0A432VBL4_9HYPH|nr:amino acid adenylation domain-containing protein [Pseudaminobacter arsenicus]